NSLNDFFCHQFTCKFCGNDAHVGYNCPAQVPCFQTLPSFPQQYPCCEDCEVLPEADHCQPPQYTVNHPIFNAHNDLLSSRTTLMEQMEQLTSMCEMIDSLLDEFASELTLLKSISPGIDETDCHPENEIRLTKRLLYNNLSPRPPEEFDFENSYAEIESFSPSPILDEDSDSFMEEIDLPFTPDDPMPPSIKDDDD
nr:hypothetical protein [Tanacetum cinerariifolium]